MVGFARLLARKGKKFVLHKLIQNACEQDVTRLDVILVREPGSRVAELVVEDDDLAGFANLAYAWTLFADSTKRGATKKRGRFNLGEKLVLALCEEAEIITTSGSAASTPRVAITCASGGSAVRASRDASA